MITFFHNELLNDLCIIQLVRMKKTSYRHSSKTILYGRQYTQKYWGVER